MSTTVKSGRAWVPATVTTLLVVMLLSGCGLLREILEDQGVEALRDPDSLVGAYVYNPLAPAGGPGIVGDRDFGDSIAQLGGGLVPLVILVFLFTWLAARAARAGSSFTVLLGAWLGTVLGAGLGAVASFQVFVWQNDRADEFASLHALRVDQFGAGLYWGVFAGLVAGVVAMVAWRIARPGAAESAPEVAPEPGPPDHASYPPPGEHERPATAPPPAEETVRAPEHRREP